MADVNIKGITKAFGAVPVIHGVECHIADGEFIVILGPSGCGKSTLLRIIAGLETQTSGDIEIGSRNVNKVEPKDRNIAMVFQNYALYPHMSVYENMAYGLRVRGMNRAEIEARVKQAAAVLSLEGLLDRKPRQLSGGQRQRVAMGRAIVREPDVFLFDEPLSNLDAKLRVAMRLEIKRLHQQLGTTSIYVTHDQVEAMTLADRLVVMNEGRVEQIGPPMTIYARPQTAYVAGFIGAPAMNLIPGRLSDDGAGVTLEGGGRLSCVPKTRSADETAVTVGLRPEDLRLVSDGSEPVANPIEMTVELIEPLGADCLIHGRMGPDALTLRVPGATRIDTGRSTLRLAIDPAHVHVFAAVSGQRLN